MPHASCHDNIELTLFENGNIVEDEIELSRIFKDFYINIVRHITALCNTIHKLTNQGRENYDMFLVPWHNRQHSH